MAHNYTVSINNVHDIKNLISELEAYRQSLGSKVFTACNILATRGVSIASANAGRFRTMIRFSTVINSVTGQTAEVLLEGEDAVKIISKWVDQYGDTNTATVSPILMAEFGSGSKAQNPLDVSGVGRGTFPNQKHAYQPMWHWKESEDGEWKTSSGIAPTQPMYKARNQMMQMIVDVFREVFEA